MINTTPKGRISDHIRSPLKDDVSGTLNYDYRKENLSPDLSLGKCKRQLWTDRHIVHGRARSLNDEESFEFMRRNHDSTTNSMRHRSPHISSFKRSTPVKTDKELYHNIPDQMTGKEKLLNPKVKKPVFISFSFMGQKYKYLSFFSLILIALIVLIVMVSCVSDTVGFTHSSAQVTFGRNLRANNNTTTTRQHMWHRENDTNSNSHPIYRPFSLTAFQHILMNFKPPFMAYIVQEGKLYIRRHHLQQLKQIDSGNDYADRVQYIHAMISDALKMGVRGMKNEEGRKQHPEFMKIIGSSGQDSSMEQKKVRPVIFPLLIQFTNNASCSILSKTENNRVAGWPFLSWAANAVSLDCEAIPVPGYFMWKEHKEKLTSKHWDPIFRQQHINFPWETKLPLIIWRGQSKEKSKEFQHEDTTLLSHSLKHPDLINAAYMDSQFELKHLMKFRAIIDINGNHHGAQHFGNLLCSNSVVVKVKPAYVEYFFHEIIPWVHYIPVSADLSDLMTVARFVADDSNKDIMLEIIENANIFCQKRFTRTRMALDVLKTLSSYSEGLDRDNMGWRDQWLSEFDNMHGSLDLVQV